MIKFAVQGMSYETRRGLILDRIGTNQDLGNLVPELVTSSVKTIKGEDYGILTGIVYLSPADESDWNLCPWASPGCRAACLGHSSGQMVFSTSKIARLCRTLLFMTARYEFERRLRREIANLEARARRRGLRPFVRLNGTSDLPFHSIFPTLMEDFPNVQFYDYTKCLERMNAFLRGELPTNYHLTFSKSETNPQACRHVLDRGGNVAIVFAGDLPKRVYYDPEWHEFTRSEYAGAPNSYNVVDGDKHDGRPTDSADRSRRGVVVGLTTKGPLAAKDLTGFVVR